MTENEAKLLEKLDELANDSEVDMYSVATLNAYFEECGNEIRGLLEEIQQHRAIGTVEEFKALKEKSVAKKPIKHALRENKVMCPHCTNWLEAHSSKVFCCYCGRKIDWSE